MNYSHLQIIDENKIQVKFARDNKEDFFNISNYIKSLSNRVFDPISKNWIISYFNQEVVNSLSKFGFDTTEIKVRQEIKAEEITEINKDIEKENHLFPFQKRGVQFLFDKNGRGLIADDMGLGKTIQAVTYIKLNNEYPVLIITPSSLKLNWKKEIKKWTEIKEEQIMVISGKNNNLPKNKKIYIINYDILSSNLEELKKIDFKVMIYDEAHATKNPKSIRTKAIKEISKNIKKVIALTGTPITNKPVEIFPTLNILNPNRFNNFYQFANKFCGAKYTKWGWDYNGASNLEELNDILTKSVMIRRKKDEVLKDLPEKIISVLPLESNEKELQLYGVAENDIIEFLNENESKEKAEKAKQAEIIVRFNKLKQLSYNVKRDSVIQWIKDTLEIKNKLVIMAWHKNTIDNLMKEFGNIAVKLDGSMSIEEKNNSVDQFQNNDNIKLFIGNIKSSGVGITLTSADILAFIEYAWTPADMVQAEDRIHRIGQKNSCNIYYLISENTIDEDIVGIIDNKRKVISKIIDGIELDEDSLLSGLIKKFKN